MKLNLAKEIYHGYDDDYIDGTLILMESNNDCAYPTRNSFWKHPRDVYTGVKTRSQTKKSAVATRFYMNFYFNQIENKHQNNTN